MKITEIFIPDEEIEKVSPLIPHGMAFDICKIPAGATIIEVGHDDVRGGYSVTYSEPGDEATLSVGTKEEMG